MNIERTTDFDFIHACVTHPMVWAATADDGSGEASDLYFPKMDDSVFWIRAEDYGVFMLHAHNSILYECHTLLLPIAHGKAKDIAEEALAWAFANTPAERIITNVPRFNEAALRLAVKVGFRQFGVNEKSFKKNGILHDQIMLGINKGE